MYEQNPNTKQGDVILHGVAPDSGNLGLNALCSSLIDCLREVAPETRLGVLGYSRGIEPMGGSTNVDRIGAYHTRRLHRHESLWNIRVCARLGGLSNPIARRLLGARAFLDASGGDSFTDLYGMRRFWSMVRPKQIALENGVPLVFLPQTYGPFQMDRTRRIARDLLRRAEGAWARDPRSYEAMRGLLGDDFDPRIHRAGVDMAFALEPRRPSGETLSDELLQTLTDGSRETVGLNVSGLIYDDPAQARERFGFRASYNDAIMEIATRLLESSNASLLLVPHVISTTGARDCDVRACEDVRTRLADRFVGRVLCLPRGLDERETKWCVSRCGWFMGTRMHSTIAALGSGVPCASVAYSLKTLGVFETCGLGDQVADPRELDTGEVVERVLDSYNARVLIGARLAQYLPSVKAEARRQIHEIAESLGIASCSSVATPQAA